MSFKKYYLFSLYAVCLMMHVSPVWGAGGDEEMIKEAESQTKEDVTLKKRREVYEDELKSYKELVKKRKTSQTTQELEPMLKKLLQERLEIYDALIARYPEAKIHEVLWLLEVYLDFKEAVLCPYRNERVKKEVIYPYIAQHVKKEVIDKLQRLLAREFRFGQGSFEDNLKSAFELHTMLLNESRKERKDALYKTAIFKSKLIETFLTL